MPCSAKTARARAPCSKPERCAFAHGGRSWSVARRASSRHLRGDRRRRCGDLSGTASGSGDDRRGKSFLGHLPNTRASSIAASYASRRCGIYRDWANRSTRQRKLGRLPIAPAADDRNRQGAVAQRESHRVRRTHQLAVRARDSTPLRDHPPASARSHVILYVTHRMEEVYELCDAATVFRDGRHVRRGIRWQVSRRTRSSHRWSAETSPTSTTIAAGRTAHRRCESRACSGPASPSRSHWLSSGRNPRTLRPCRRRPHRIAQADLRATRARTAGYPRQRTAGQDRQPADAIRAGLVFCPEDRKRKESFRSARSGRTSISAPGATPPVRVS